MDDPSRQEATLWQIFVSFTKVGALLFGGGYAMLPLLEKEVVERRGWCKQEEMSDYYAMSQLVPGVIAINTAMLIGQHLRGFAGSLAATLGVVCVPFWIILLYAILFDQLSHLEPLKRAMSGLRPAVAGMMLGVSYKLFKRSGKTRLGIVVSVSALILVLILKVSAITVILTGVLAGIIWWLVALKMDKRKKIRNKADKK